MVPYAAAAGCRARRRGAPWPGRLASGSTGSGPGGPDRTTGLPCWSGSSARA